MKLAFRGVAAELVWLGRCRECRARRSRICGVQSTRRTAYLDVVRIRCTRGPAQGDAFEATFDPRGAIVIEGDPYTPTDADLNGFEVIQATPEELRVLREAGFRLVGVPGDEPAVR